jgi:hypothetical protein
MDSINLPLDSLGIDTPVTPARALLTGDLYTVNGKTWRYDSTIPAWIPLPTPFATQAEMEAGTEAAARVMSPLRVKQAVEELAPAMDQTAIQTAITDKPAFRTNIGAQPAGSYATLTGTETLANKRTPPRVTTIASEATPTVNTDNCDMVSITAQAAAITSMTANLTGMPSNGEMLLYRIKDNGTARAITWGASFVAMGSSLPSTTVISKVLHALFIWDSVTSKWGCISTAYEA